MGIDDRWAGDAPEVEFLILAEHAETIHGKLYLMGGAWETMHVASFDAAVSLTLAVSILVPWHATNQPHTLSVSVQTADGDVLTLERRQVMVGRPTHIEPASTQRTLLVLELRVNLPEPARYAVVAGINDISQARLSFRAVPGHVHG